MTYEIACTIAVRGQDTKAMAIVLQRLEQLEQAMQKLPAGREEI